MIHRTPCKLDFAVELFLSVFNLTFTLSSDIWNWLKFWSFLYLMIFLDTAWLFKQALKGFCYIHSTSWSVLSFFCYQKISVHCSPLLGLLQSHLHIHFHPLLSSPWLTHLLSHSHIPVYTLPSSPLPTFHFPLEAPSNTKVWIQVRNSQFFSTAWFCIQDLCIWKISSLYLVK